MPYSKWHSVAKPWGLILASRWAETAVTLEVEKASIVGGWKVVNAGFHRRSCRIRWWRRDGRRRSYWEPGRWLQPERTRLRRCLLGGGVGDGHLGGGTVTVVFECRLAGVFEVIGGANFFSR